MSENNIMDKGSVMKKLSAVLVLLLLVFIMACGKTSEGVKEQVSQPQVNTQELKSVRRVAHTVAFYAVDGNGTKLDGSVHDQTSVGGVSLLLSLKNNTSKVINKVSIKTTGVQFNDLANIDSTYAKNSKDYITQNLGSKVWSTGNIPAGSVVEKSFNLYLTGFGIIANQDLQNDLDNNFYNFDYVKIFNALTFRTADLTNTEIDNSIENNGIDMLLVKTLDIEIEYTYADGSTSVEKKTLSFDNKVYKVLTNGTITNGTYKVGTTNSCSVDKIENYI